MESKKERLARLQRERRARYKEAGHRDPATLKYQYGLSLAELAELETKYAGHCGICQRMFKDAKDTVIDHCHTTNKVRGLLCRKCNVGLGMFEDNPESLAQAVEYLKCL